MKQTEGKTPDIAETYNYHLVEKHAAWTEAGPIVSRLSDPEIALLEGRAAATVAEPATLGLFGFATGTWIAGVVFGGFLPASAQVPLAPIVFLFAGVAQFIAGLYAFRRTNVLESNAFTCYGAFNTVVGLTILLEAGGLIPRGPASFTILGYFACSFAFISLVLMVAALSKNMILAGTLAFLVAGYALVGIGLFNVGPNGAVGGVAEAGGACLFGAAALAYYAGSALVINSSWKRTILPLFGEP